MNTRPWYKRYPSNFISGTYNLTVEEKGMYCILLDLIYDAGGPISDDDQQQLGRVAGCATRIAGRLRDSLIVKGKIYRTADGRLSNRRAEKELELGEKEHKTRQLNGQKGGETSAKLRQKPNENNHLMESGLEHTRSQIPDTRSTRSLSESESAPARSPRGKRLPDDWRPSDAGVALAGELGLDIERTQAIFRDYWLAQPGQKGRKADWEATWRNWCRREQERGQQTKLPMLRAIDGGKSPQPTEPVDPNDHWGIDAWCGSLDGASPITDPELLKTGKWGYKDKVFIDAVARKVADAAGFSRSWRGDWSPLAQWIDSGLRPGEHIYPVVKKLADFFRTKGEPATNLRVFDKAVRERKAA